MPLAERMRPKSLEQLVGHEDLVGPKGVLRELILTDRVPSMILWAGPGVSLSSATVSTRFRWERQLWLVLSRIQRNHASKNSVRHPMASMMSKKYSRRQRMNYVSQAARQLFSWTKYIGSRKHNKMFFSRLLRKGQLHCKFLGVEVTVELVQRQRILVLRLRVPCYLGVGCLS